MDLAYRSAAQSIFCKISKYEFRVSEKTKIKHNTVMGHIKL